MMAARLEGECRLSIALDKSASHFIPDLKMSWTDCRTEPGHKRSRICSHRRYGLFHDSSGQSAPPAMKCTHRGSFAVAQQYGQAVGYKNRADASGALTECSVATG